MMSRMRVKLVRFLRRAGMNEAGVAAVEFALILPIMLTLYLGSIEVSSAIIADQRVTSVAGALGDLVARADGDITLGQLSDYFDAAKSTMTPYSSDGVSQVVTSVYVNADGDASVRWSRRDNNTAGYAAGSEYELPEELTDIARGKYVIVSEASLTYEPVFSYVLRTNLNLYHEFFYMPRFGAEIDLE